MKQSVKTIGLKIVKISGISFAILLLAMILFPILFPNTIAEEVKKFANHKLNGELNFKSAIITLSDVRRGKHIIFGKAKIKFKGKLIEWKLLEGNQEDFPKSTIFYLLLKF